MAVWIYYLYLLVVWGGFRFLFVLPELVEEIWIKPVIWLLPVLILWRKNKGKPRFFEGKWLTGVLWGLGVGGALALVLGGLSLLQGRSLGLAALFNQDLSWWGVLGVGLATATTEEIVFSGWIFQNLLLKFKQLWLSLLMVGGMFALIHIPIGLFVYKYDLADLSGLLVLVMLVMMINAWLMNKSRNILSSIVSHWVWGVVILALT